ncbi:potassium-transporting ATPase subunit A, partial [bacterium]|nr:potassium-transporting ATPase subunit A [bacterium]
SILLSVLLIGQGVIQNFHPPVAVTTIEGGTQQLPMGPVASQVAIKQLGTNGGGFFGANSAHPFENPTPLSNFLELLAILLIPAALPFAFGRMVGQRKQGMVLFAVMLMLFLTGLGVSLWSEYSYNASLGMAAPFEGKELRIGTTGSVLWSTATTAASNGSVNAMHDSLSPLAGLVAMLNIMLGEVVFGGVGCGLYGMLMFALIGVFIAGLMVGRTPEYLGKKIEVREIILTLVAILGPSVVMLLFTALACIVPSGYGSLANKGPHGLSEMLYAFASAAGNNGSAFGGLNAAVPFYSILTGLAMLIGRFVVLIPAIAIGGSLAAKKQTPESAGTMRTDTPLFAMLLLFTILVVGALTFFPALSLGRLIEHLLMGAGRVF